MSKLWLILVILTLFTSTNHCLESSPQSYSEDDSKHSQTEILSYCGDPGRPPKSQISPVQSTYTDDESVTYTCDQFISLKQHRKCVRGQWVGQTPVCGEAFRDNDVVLARYIDLDSGRITNEYNLTDVLEPFPKFGNSFIAERYIHPVRGEQAKNYRVELTLKKPTQVQMVRISFSVVDHLINKAFESSEFYISNVFVNDAQECQKVANNSVSPWHFNSTRFDFWFFCRAKLNRGFDASKDLTNKVTIETRCDIPVKIDLATFILAEVYNNNDNRSDPICGQPEVPLGQEARVINDRSRYSFSCAPNFVRTSTSGGQFHLRTCGHDMNWHGKLPVCSPVRSCPKFGDGERSLLVEVFKYDRIFYTNSSDWQPVAGSRAFFRCKDETHIFVGKEIRTCSQDGEWTHSMPNCLVSAASDNLRTTTIMIIVFVTLIVTFILSSATIYFFLKMRSSKNQTGNGFPGLEMTDSAYYADTCDALKCDGELYETLEPQAEVRYTSGYQENPVLLKTSQFQDDFVSYERIGDFRSGLNSNGPRNPEIRFMGTEGNDYYDDSCAIQPTHPEPSSYRPELIAADDQGTYQPMMRRF